jgi:hypothetical protein
MWLFLRHKLHPKPVPSDQTYFGKFIQKTSQFIEFVPNSRNSSEGKNSALLRKSIISIAEEPKTDLQSLLVKTALIDTLIYIICWGPFNIV